MFNFTLKKTRNTESTVDNHKEEEKWLLIKPKQSHKEPKIYIFLDRPTQTKSTKLINRKNTRGEGGCRHLTVEILSIWVRVRKKT